MNIGLARQNCSVPDPSRRFERSGVEEPASCDFRRKGGNPRLQASPVHESILQVGIEQNSCLAQGCRPLQERVAPASWPVVLGASRPLATSPGLEFRVVWPSLRNAPWTAVPGLGWGRRVKSKKTAQSPGRGSRCFCLLCLAHPKAAAQPTPMSTMMAHQPNTAM